MRGRATTAGSPRARARVGIPARGRPPAPTPGPTGSRDLSGFPRSLGGQMPAAAGRPPAPTHPGVSHPPEFSELADDRRTGAPQSPARLGARGSRARKGAASRSTRPPAFHPVLRRRKLPTQIGSSPRKSGAGPAGPQWFGRGPEWQWGRRSRTDFGRFSPGRAPLPPGAGGRGNPTAVPPPPPLPGRLRAEFGRACLWP